MASLFGQAQQTQQSTQASPIGELSKDVEVSQPPDDSITSIQFSMASGQQNDFLAVASWDKFVRIYEIDSNGNSQGRHVIASTEPVFDCYFSKDGTKLAAVGAEKSVKVCDLATQQDIVLGTHDMPIRKVRWFDAGNGGGQFVVTGSWDKSVRYWDLRQQGPVCTLACQDRVYAMDVKDQLLVVGTADRYLNVVDLRNPASVYKTIPSSLKWQTRVVSCFGNGFALGSLEGRCAIQYIEDKDKSLSYTFKCHRGNPVGNQPAKIYSLNDISFHPIQGTFSTAGSDGAINFWDKDAKNRLRAYPSAGAIITSTSFNKTGTIFAYAMSYDWSAGYQANVQNYPTKIMLHPVTAEECTPRARLGKK